MMDTRSFPQIPAVSQLRPVSGDNYLTTEDVCERYDVDRRTLRNWQKTRGFPEPVKMVRKNYYSFPEIRKWEVRQAGRDVNAEFAVGHKVVSTVVRTYEDFIAAMKARKIDLGLTNDELEVKSGLADGHVTKLENYGKSKNARGMGPETFPLWLGGLKCGLVLVELPRRPKKGKHAEEQA